MNVEHNTVSLGEFEFDCGETIPELEITYEAYGEFDGDNAVLVCHALTGSAHVAGRDRVDSADQARAWWDDIVGPGKAIDTTEYYVVCANVPGSCYGSTGPKSENPETGEPYGTDFPPVTVTDWTEAQRALLDELGIPHLHAVVGGSVGGMNVIEWAKRHPDHVDRIVPIAAAARLDTQCLSLDAIARRAITTDPNWKQGHYYGEDDEPPSDGLALARQLGHVMYLSKASMERRFGRRAAGRDAVRTFPTDAAGAFFPYRDVESYLDYNAEKFTERFDANSYLYLTRAMDNYDLAAGFESDADALAAFDGDALVMSFTADWHFTTQQAEALADSLRAADANVAHHVIDSDHGHDAFLVEPDNVGPPLADFLDAGVDGNAVTDSVVEDSQESNFAPVHNSLFSQ
ncbi:homoserine O-acetyltransferase [Haloarcula marismortui ATCC 43049]|uniref:Homoserine O-acetyltransferase n=2 Tax=Haloarcula marismortui (strain ATCC 43049 / DSM 3752 / JCM 8966 / VKM B-1809) TaxID=272569 RepID=METXA_HALMA|nr:homoserine O-acetyltransferase [Haloarcula marismortui]Q5UY71.1 RecName: Full=Homoserine O-acetyltransferase; Short=HAT; AltName: Full=Homoserine transacetylase; Short=HTA [Haloarcula marismortui ATCC 43049]AAV47782.1 homoserine O-acetyltransferase [Haloarcula marismortui ATCC 43049]QCP92463.1 homoserine O-acetyltransferase [Haloarcula marismortui ATCC 43049]